MLSLFEEEYHKELGGLTDAVAGLYQEVLSEEDIAGIVAFYQSPVGQKLLAAGTHFEQNIQTAAKNWSQSASQAAFGRAMARAE